MQRPRNIALCVAAGALVSSVSAAVPAVAVPGSPACKNVALAWAGGTARPGGGSDQQETARVQVKNSGGRTCSLLGAPSVMLTTNGAPETLLQQPGGNSVNLTPGRTARFTITFLSDSGKNGNEIVRPDQAVVTLPGGTVKTLTWKWGGVTRQEAASRPGNFVSPIA
ncbi:uncharacterized protein DUF4232 [Streptomyces puniciscabiei]|uniref:Uncharacterized protein DUF4232 n=1 Tax=Streptomyces puniciscabiei TaxID=164348 RepID=A0A542TJA3_9ACTN|nr:DUF4232 domain-containing protein [Streptomyces puniciscabiei]TQK86929.1 uncharacterized protein DUF4232 [Streptomyces puniciscabiei]